MTYYETPSAAKAACTHQGGCCEAEIYYVPGHGFDYLISGWGFTSDIALRHYRRGHTVATRQQNGKWIDRSVHIEQDEY
jgi:hypothetical protein